MAIPSFLLRKLYQRGSLREVDDGFTFTLQNTLGSATLIAPPKFVINGMSFKAADLHAEAVALDTISEENPYKFTKGAQVAIRFPGRLLRGGNRIHIVVSTKEFGRLDFLVEDKLALDDSEE